MKRPARAPSQLSESLHHRLNAYVLAASAAGVGVLALAQPAEAKIVYTKAHHVIRAGDIYYLDLNHDGVADFLFQNVFESNSVTSVLDWWLAVNPSGHNGVRGHTSASALQSGKRIGGGQAFLGHRNGYIGIIMATVNFQTDTYIRGPWANVKNRYLGLQFHIREKVHYGWARLNVSAKVGNITGTLTGYAYETIANKPIITGKTHGKDDATLGRLAQGASGVAVWR